MARHTDIDPLFDPDTGALDRSELFRRIRGWLAVVVSFGVLLGGAGYVAAKGYDAYQETRYAHDFPGPGSGEVNVVVPKNSTAAQIGKVLVEAGVVKEAKRFAEVASSRPDLYAKLKAGRYKLTKQITAAEALQQLVDPKREVKVLLQLKEASRLDPVLYDAMAAITKIPAAAYKKELSSTVPQALGVPAWGPTSIGDTSFEGFLFPDTYEVPDGVKVTTMPKVAIKQFNDVIKRIDFVNKASKLDFGDPKDTPNTKAWKALIVASIIEREVFREEDRSKVARVILNRLKVKKPLQLDSTVAYAFKLKSTIFTTDTQRKTPNPYNTYYVSGLPAGPISAPGEAALSAAVNPAEGPWIFFMPVNLDTGETKFTVTDAEHNAARAQFQAWCTASPENLKKCQ